MSKLKKIGAVSAAALVVANMLGTGVFTGLGLQLNLVQNSWSLLLLWLLGAVMAVFGALSYAELGTRYPRLGGEYRYLSELIHPLAGYLAGWVSLTVAFPAAIALSAMAMGAYIAPYAGVSETLIAVVAVLLISAIHSVSLLHSRRFQNVSTALKLLVLLAITVAGLYLPGQGTPDWGASWQEEVITPAFSVAFLFSVYAYSGWNAAAYVVEEIRRPERNLPMALLLGTAIVALLYIGMQWALLRQIPADLLRGKIEVGQLAGQVMFGDWGGRLFSTAISLFLVSGISAMVWVGPRVTRAVAEDYRFWRFLKKDNKHGIPVRAIWFQAAISLLLLLSGSFERMLLYSGFVLQAFTALTVAALFIARKRKPRPGGVFLSPAYPYVQIAFLITSMWVMVFMIYRQPRESLAGGLLLALGLVFYEKRA